MANFNWFSRSFNQPSQADESDQPKAENPSAPETEKAAAAEQKSSAMSPDDYLAWAKAAYQNIQQQQTAPTAESEAAVSEEAPPETTEVVEATPSAIAATPDSTGETAAAEPTPDTAPPAPPVAAVAAETPTAPEADRQDIPPETEPTASSPTPAASQSTTEAELAAEATAATVEVADTSAAPSESGTDVPLNAVAAEATATDTAAPPPSAPAVPSGPAWMQAAAERQARLERLQETAIAEPEPEPEPAPTTATEVAPALPDINFDEAFLWSAEVLAGQGRSAADISIEEITWLNKLRQGLDKTRRGLVNQLKAIVGQGPLNEEAVFEIEALLLQADVGVEATDAIIEALQAKLREEALPPEQAIAYLKKILRNMLDEPLGESHNLEFVPEKDTFNIWLMTGVNGAGKTTTIGKLAHIAKKSGYSCLIGAADTFRAAAVEQVKAWGARSDVDVIANPGKNTDPAAVVFDAITAAQSRQCELLLVDTAGRLQNKKNLMDELSKIRRIIDKKAPDAKVESLLVLDATLGQNGLQQARVFAEAANLSGVVLTKLDGTARGGVALAVVQQLGLPIRFIGAGEGIEDLRPFSSYEFVEALLSG